MEQHTSKKRKLNTYCIEYQLYTPQDDIQKLYNLNKKLLEEMISLKLENQKLIEDVQLILKRTKNQSPISPPKESIDNVLNLDKLTFNEECSYIN